MEGMEMKKLTNILALLLVVLLVLPVGAQAAQLIPGGQLVGLELHNNTITIAAFDDNSPAKLAGLQVGDQITHIDHTPINSPQQIRSLLKSAPAQIEIQFLRKGQAKTLTFSPRASGAPLGIYLKQGITGVGTLTYYDPATGKFGALGHCVSDQQGNLLNMTDGSAYDAHVMTVKKGKSGTPGQIVGAMETGFFGRLYKNLPQGVFGNVQTPLTGTPIETASAEQVHTGPATIRSTVTDDGVQDYSVKILKIYPASRSGGRNMLIKITDQRLLDTTGGIVQGMSGSPIIQDGKLVGAVTHVLVNDPTMGYGIFIENMLGAAA